MSEAAAAPATPAAAPATPAEAAPSATEAEAPAAESTESLPFDEATLAKRPDLAAKYKKGKGKGKGKGKDAKEPPAEGKPEAEEETKEPAAEAAPETTPAEPSKVDRALAEIRDMLRENPEAVEFIEKLAKQKNLAGPFIELKKRSSALKKRERTIEDRERTIANAQQELHAAVESFKKDPRDFAKRNGFDFRQWLTDQVQEENLSPEAKRVRELEVKQRELDAKNTELEKWKTEMAEREKQLDQANAESQALTKLQGYLSSPDEQKQFPHVFAAYDVPDLASGIWATVRERYRQTGEELDWRRLLQQEESRLRLIHERLSRPKDNRAANGSSSERANGSQSANPAGKQEPTSLSNAEAAERVSEARPPKNREDYLNQVLSRHGIS